MLESSLRELTVGMDEIIRVAIIRSEALYSMLKQCLASVIDIGDLCA